LAQRLSPGTRQLSFGEALHGVAKDEAFAHASLFILPTRSENFGNVVAEALAQGVPVITTTGAPWVGLLEHGCGWWIAPDAPALASTLREAMTLPPTELRAMGERGRSWMHATHSWERVAQAMAEAYRALRSK